MLLLFGFLALRLLGAALATLLYLLLAPLAVLAPALGDGGRDTFRLWALRLLGALLSKLVYSVALGVVLMVVALLESLDTLGWWTQWLLVSVFWWTAFEHRHRILGLVLHERASRPAARRSRRAFLAGRPHRRRRGRCSARHRPRGRNRGSAGVRDGEALARLSPGRRLAERWAAPARFG